MAQSLIKNTEPSFSAFDEPYLETDMGSQDPAGWGLCAFCPAER